MYKYLIFNFHHPLATFLSFTSPSWGETMSNRVNKLNSNETFIRLVISYWFGRSFEFNKKKVRLSPPLGETRDLLKIPLVDAHKNPSYISQFFYFISVSALFFFQCLVKLPLFSIQQLISERISYTLFPLSWACFRFTATRSSAYMLASTPFINSKFKTPSYRNPT